MLYLLVKQLCLKLPVAPPHMLAQPQPPVSPAPQLAHLAQPLPTISTIIVASLFLSKFLNPISPVPPRTCPCTTVALTPVERES